eukprot:338043-Lingulodinium_polyedra.AAC.1
MSAAFAQAVHDLMTAPPQGAGPFLRSLHKFISEPRLAAGYWPPTVWDNMNHSATKLSKFLTMVLRHRA